MGVTSVCWIRDVFWLDLVGAPSTKPQTHVFWLGPPAPKVPGSDSKIHLESRCLICDLRSTSPFVEEGGGALPRFAASTHDSTDRSRLDDAFSLKDFVPVLGVLSHHQHPAHTKRHRVKSHGATISTLHTWRDKESRVIEPPSAPCTHEGVCINIGTMHTGGGFGSTTQGIGSELWLTAVFTSSARTAQIPRLTFWTQQHHALPVFVWRCPATVRPASRSAHEALLTEPPLQTHDQRTVSTREPPLKPSVRLAAHCQRSTAHGTRVAWGTRAMEETPQWGEAPAMEESHFDTSNVFVELTEARHHDVRCVKVPMLVRVSLDGLFYFILKGFFFGLREREEGEREGGGLNFFILDPRHVLPHSNHRC